MKKYFIIAALCTLGSLQSMEQWTANKAPVELNVQDYDNGNRLQTIAFCYFLEINEIPLKGKILSVDSGTGNIEKRLANKPDIECIDGFNSRNNIVNFANRKHANEPKLRFYQSFAEELTPEKTGKLYDSGFASFSFNCFEDKPLALKKICESLKTGGHFFFTAHCSEDPKPINLVAAEEMMSSIATNETLDAFIKKIREDLKAKNIFCLADCEIPKLTSDLSDAIKLFFTDQTKATGSSYPTRTELKNMVEDAGFEILICSQQLCNIIFKNHIEVEDVHRPIVMSSPIMQYIPSIFHEYLFTKFKDLLITKLERIGILEYIGELITTIVHVRKK